MLTAYDVELVGAEDPYGVQLVGGLGFPGEGALRSIGDQVYQAGKGALEAVGNLTCKVAGNSAVQAGANYSQYSGNPQAMSAGKGIQFVDGMCQALKPPAAPPFPQPIPPIGGSGIKVATFYGGGKVTGAKPAPSAYPAGAIAAFDPKMASYRIAIPMTGVAGLLGDGLSGLFTQVATSATLPSGVTLVSLDKLKEQLGEKPWYKNWKVLVPVGVGVLAAAGVGWYVIRSR